MKNLLRNSFLLLAVLIVNCLTAQVSDTVVVYEYIYKTDTVWLEPKPVRDTIVFGQLKSIEDATLIIDTTNRRTELVIFSSGGSATIPINSIIYTGNQDQSKMKRKGFLTLLLLPFHLFSFGQAEVNIYTGSTSHWFQHNASTISNPMWLGAHTGVELSIPLKNENWSISTGVELQSIFPTTDYLQTKAVDQNLPYLERDFVQIQTNSIINELNTGLFNSPFKQINFPLKLSRQLGKWRPYFGVSGWYSFFICQLPIHYYSIYSPENYYQNNPKPKTHFFNVALLTGTHYSFSKKLGLKIELSQGLTGRNNEFEDRIKPTAGVEEYYFKSSYLNLSLVFTL